MQDARVVLDLQFDDAGQMVVVFNTLRDPHRGAILLGALVFLPSTGTGDNNELSLRPRAGTVGTSALRTVPRLHDE